MSTVSTIKGKLVTTTKPDNAPAANAGQSPRLAETASRGTPAANTSLISVVEADYTLNVAGAPLQILRKVSLEVAPAQVVAIVGPSGSGKTSLLMLLAGLERTTGGKVVIAGQDLTGLSEDELAVFRRKTLGFVFQSFHLIPSLSALDNVALALEIASPGRSLPETRKVAAEALAAVGLGERLAHRPSALSGGEQQRVAIARALANNPKVLLADEPTGNLDSIRAHELLGLLRDMVNKDRLTILMVTHDQELANSFADRIVFMKDGRVV